jgi:hypothetical protein
VTHPLPTDRSFVGVAPEATEGVAVAPTAFLRPSAWAPIITTPFGALTGLQASQAKVLGEVPDLRSVTIEASGPIYPDELGWYLSNLLPDTTAGGGFTTFAVKNPVPAQPGSLSFTDFDGEFCRVYAGCKASSLQLSFGAGLGSMVASLTGMTAADAATPVPFYSASSAVPSWQAKPLLDNNPAVGFTGLTVRITRSLTLVDGASTTLTGIRVGADLDVSGTAAIVYDSMYGRTVAGYFEQGVVVPLTVTLGGVGLIAMQTVQLTRASLVRQSGSFESLDVIYTAVANAADVGPSGGVGPATVQVASSLVYT